MKGRCKYNLQDDNIYITICKHFLSNMKIEQCILVPHYECRFYIAYYLSTSNFFAALCFHTCAALDLCSLHFTVHQFHNFHINKTSILKVLLREQSKLLCLIKKSLNPENLEDLEKSGKNPEKSENRKIFQKRRSSDQI